MRDDAAHFSNVSSSLTINGDAMCVSQSTALNFHMSLNTCKKVIFQKRAKIKQE